MTNASLVSPTIAYAAQLNATLQANTSSPLEDSASTKLINSAVSVLIVIAFVVLSLSAMVALVVIDRRNQAKKNQIRHQERRRARMRKGLRKNTKDSKDSGDPGDPEDDKLYTIESTSDHGASDSDSDDRGDGIENAREHHKTPTRVSTETIELDSKSLDLESLNSDDELELDSPVGRARSSQVSESIDSSDAKLSHV